MARSSQKPDLKALQDLISSTLTLLKQFSASLHSTSTIATTTHTPIENPPHSLDLLRDSGKLLKAHTTKISLLAINKPFTPTAISKVLRDLSGTCLPAMITASQICSQPDQLPLYGTTLSHEISLRVKRVFLEMQNLLTELQSISSGNASGATAARDALSSTGVVWESCDALISLHNLGTAGLAVQKAEQYRDTIKDAIAELQQWKDGTDLDAEGHRDELLGSDDEGVDGDSADSLDELFNAANSMPKDRPELKELVEEAEAKLKKVVFLYTAMVKRRLKGYRVQLGKVEVLDGVLNHLLAAQVDVDEMISHFYDLDEHGAREELGKCVDEAKAAAALAKLDWIGKEDEFTVWSKKWEEALG